MDKILDKMHHRRAFFLVVSLLIVVLLLVRFWVLPSYDESLKTSVVAAFSLLANSLIVSLVVTIFIGSFVFWFTISPRLYHARRFIQQDQDARLGEFPLLLGKRITFTKNK